MANLAVTALIPRWDVTLDIIDPSALLGDLEALDEQESTETAYLNRTSGGTYLDTCSVFTWVIAEADLAAAQTAYNSFIGSFTWVHPPELRAVALASLGE